jgi:hypothetical protein
VGVVVAVMQTLPIPVMKDLPQLLDTEASNATWVVTATPGWPEPVGSTPWRSA